MYLLIQALTRNISTKIILPYLLLALLLTTVVTLVAARLTAGSLQDRLDNRLVEAGQVTSDGLVALEDRQIEELRAVAFTEGMAEAVMAGDRSQLETLLRPIWASAGLSALVVFDAGGTPLLAWRRIPGAGPDVPPAPLALPDLNQWWLARQILDRASDGYGDKFSAFYEGRLWTAAPIRAGPDLAGGALVATSLDDLLALLQGRSQASITTFYNGRGIAVATTQILTGDTHVPAIPLATLQRLTEVRTTPGPGHIQDIVAINGREYQLAYSPLRVRRTMDGFFAVALPRNFIVNAWQTQRGPLLLLNLGLLMAVVTVGTLVARQLTGPLAELVATARAVTGGDLQRRSLVRSHDEVGQLAHAFNQMTGTLLHLYREVAREGERRAAILSGIADAVIVCDVQGRVVLMNPAAEGLLGLRDWQEQCYTFEQLPLELAKAPGLATPEGRMAYYQAGDRTLSASFAALPGAGEEGGEVIVLRDISTTAALDQAKTNLIALISHELRTPLTAIQGASELLCRGVGGALEPLHQSLAETALRQSQAMSALIDKAIMVAAVELGELAVDLQPARLYSVVETAVNSLHTAAAAAGAELTIEVSTDLPLVQADTRLLTYALRQLLDNAIQYGQGAPIHIDARNCDSAIALTVHDDGPGIAADQLPYLFERMRRNDNALNTGPRGLGLGLPLTRDLIARQGGTLSVQSPPGEGSSFTILLPLASEVELAT